MQTIYFLKIDSWGYLSFKIKIIYLYWIKIDKKVNNYKVLMCMIIKGCDYLELAAWYRSKSNTNWLDILENGPRKKLHP
jgi:hypothetical protein